MNTIQLKDIVILSNRQRQEFDPVKIQELKNSIQDGQLLHPPVLRQEDGKWVLVAGETRLKAISEIFEFGQTFRHNGQTFSDGLVPFVNLGELSHLEAEEAELDENLRRKDLTWQEHAAAVERLHKLRIAQKEQEREEEILEGGLDLEEQLAIAVKPVHTIADTARELTGRSDGSYQETTRKEIIVAKHLDNPEVAKAKTVDEAFKILKRNEQREKNIELAKTVGATFSHEAHTILNMNCLDFMKDTTNHNRFDVILTDPPYGMGADSFGDGGGKFSGIEHHYDDSYESWLTLMASWTELSFLVTKPQAHAYVFCDIDRFHELKAMMEKAGWYVFRTPFIIHKINSGRVPLPECGPRRQWECLLYAIKGKKPVTHIYGDVISVTGDENTSHGAQKPVALYQNLLQRSVRPGDKVLDSFAGTGPILPAGHLYKCEVTAIEQTQEYYATCLKRIDDIKATESLGLDLGE